MRTHSARKKLPNWAVGLILVVVVAAASFLAYTKQLPWAHQFEVRAVFTTSQNINTNSPVRIAGVNVGKVTGVEHLTSSDPGFDQATRTADGKATGQQATVVTMEINDVGLPIHQDATMKLRPRLFLEGNLFVDLHPGTPEAPDISDGYTVPESQTSVSVQLDQVLSTLQSDVRANLQSFLHELGNSFIKYGGANGLREFYASSSGAFKNGSLVNEALLGTEPHDLSNLVRNLDSTVRALDVHESQLQNFVTNLRIVTGSFAAQDQALARGVSEIPGVLDAGRPGADRPQQVLPLAARLLRRGSARRSLDACRPRRRDAAAASAARPGVEGRAARADARSAPDDPGADPADQADHPVPAPVQGPLVLLQPGDHPLGELPRCRPGLPDARRCSRRRPTASRESPARAAAATATASTSASRARAARASSRRRTTRPATRSTASSRPGPRCRAGGRRSSPPRRRRTGPTPRVSASSRRTSGRAHPRPSRPAARLARAAVPSATAAYAKKVLAAAKLQKSGNAKQAAGLLEGAYSAWAKLTGNAGGAG